MLSKIKEIRKALKNNMPQCALALALTLPDICGQVEHPNEKSAGKRYRAWLDKFIPKDAFDSNYDGSLTAINNGVNPEFPKIDSNAIYMLRCELLHSGDAEIENDKNVSQDNYLDDFFLTVIGDMDWTDENGLGAKSGYGSYIEKDEKGKVLKRT